MSDRRQFLKSTAAAVGLLFLEDGGTTPPPEMPAGKGPWTDFYIGEYFDSEKAPADFENMATAAFRRAMAAHGYTEMRAADYDVSYAQEQRQWFHCITAELR